MPLPELSRQEMRLGRFAAFCSAVYALAALVFALFPRWIFATLGRAGAAVTAEVRFWQVLGVGLMVTVSVACALVAHSPRERRMALVPVLAGKLTSSAMALIVLASLATDGWTRSGYRAVLIVLAADFPLFAVSAWLFHSAAPGVHLSAAPTQSAPELPAPPEPVRLTVGGKQP
jgi:hypothetical protein